MHSKNVNKNNEKLDIKMSYFISCYDGMETHCVVEFLLKTVINE